MAPADFAFGCDELPRTPAQLLVYLINSNPCTVRRLDGGALSVQFDDWRTAQHTALRVSCSTNIELLGADTLYVPASDAHLLAGIDPTTPTRED